MGRRCPAQQVISIVNVNIVTLNNLTSPSHSFTAANASSRAKAIPKSVLRIHITASLDGTKKAVLNSAICLCNKNESQAPLMLCRTFYQPAPRPNGIGRALRVSCDNSYHLVDFRM